MEIVIVKRKPRKGTLGRGTSKKRVNKPKVKSKKKKEKTITWYKKELDRLFSLYIRAKYEKKCYTCGYVGKLQCGHFVSRQYLATRWDESNARPQCQMCNIWGKGMYTDFEEHLIREIGSERVQALKDKRKELWKLDRAFYEENIARYKALLEE